MQEVRIHLLLCCFVNEQIAEIAYVRKTGKSKMYCFPLSNSILNGEAATVYQSEQSRNLLHYIVDYQAVSLGFIDHTKGTKRCINNNATKITVSNNFQ